jgi:hypothetical protein
LTFWLDNVRCAVGAKANVLQSVGFVRLVAALLIMPKRLLFVFHFQFVHCLSCRSFRVSANGLRAGDRNPVLRLRQGYGACTLLPPVLPCLPWFVGLFVTIIFFVFLSCGGAFFKISFFSWVGFASSLTKLWSAG